MLSGMLGGVGLRLAILAAIAVAVGGFYLHYQNIVNERDEALQQVGALTAQNAIQAATIMQLEEVNDEWVVKFDNFQETLARMADNQVKSNEHAKRLNDVLSRHDLTALSMAKPGLIQRRINRGTAGVLGLFESETSRDKNGSGPDRKTP